jgi:replicative DNA helicase
VGPLEVPALQPERELAALRAVTAPAAPGSGQPVHSPAGQPAMFDDATADRRSDLVWDRVVEIVPAGTEDVFDLTVPGPASWLADGVVSHNSGAIEQDADIVMFIHRDDMSEDAEKKNVAELIVAKHRNGPTGNIKLQFNPNLTQFRNYAPGP